MKELIWKVDFHDRLDILYKNETQRRSWVGRNAKYLSVKGHPLIGGENLVHFRAKFELNRIRYEISDNLCVFRQK